MKIRRSTYIRLLHALASMGLSDKDLFELLEFLSSASPSEVAEAVRSLTRASNHPLVSREDFRVSIPKFTFSSDDHTISKIISLLQFDAKLSTAKAVQYLGATLVNMKVIHKNDLPPHSRKSLEDWLRRVLARVSEKDVLNAATDVRNRFTGVERLDWNLK